MKNKGLKYYTKLDGLRGVACIIVIIFHLATLKTYSSKYEFFPFKAGFLGVDLFFVLSGFLITNILVSEYFKTQKILFKKFFLKRILRLYPPILVAFFIFILPLLFIDAREAFSNAFFVLTYTTDFAIIITRYFPYLIYPNMFLHTWTLAIEEQFYLVYPFILPLYLKLCSKYNFNPKSGFLIFFTFFASIVIYSSFYDQGLLKKFFIWRFLEIFFGCFLSFFYNKKVDLAFQTTKLSKKLDVFFKSFFSNRVLLFISILSFSLLISMDFTQNLAYIQNLLITIISSVFVVNAINDSESFGFKYLKCKSLVYTGKISYGLYLFHWPIFFLLGRFDFLNLSNPFFDLIVKDIIGIVCSVIIAVLSYNLVEKKFLLLKERV